MSEVEAEAVQADALVVSGALQRVGGSGATKTSENDQRDMLLGVVVFAVLIGLSWFVGRWIFTSLFGGGSGALYEVFSAILVIAILAAGLGCLIPLPIFLGSRIISLLVCLGLLFFGVPAVQSLRTPAQVAKEEATANPEPPASDRTYSDTAVKAAAMSAIKNAAVDPSSVRFRNVTVAEQSSGTKAVCGEFNAKNRMGGYKGYERFVSAGTGQYTWIESEVADFEAAWTSICRR